MFNAVFYGIATAIAVIASYVNITDDMSQPVVSFALGMGVGTHVVLFAKAIVERQNYHD